ncbi:MAG: 4Fe-4S binding protein [Rikenellaceae bacterium]
MKISEIYEYADKIGLLTFSTIVGDEVHSRIAHLNGYDDDGIYFRTMSNKPYGRQLRESGRVTICGHYGGGILNHDDVGAEPIFAPGYSFRLIGEVCYVAPEVIIEKAESNPMLEVAARDIASYPAMAEGNFVIHKAKGEIFDYDFAKIHRSHKLLRTRFAFGGATYNPAGVRIDHDRCVACGVCHETCSFDAISLADNGKYSVLSERCDDCGSCLLKCPVEAILPSLTF